MPKRLRLLKWGVNATTEGDVVVNEATLAGFAAWQRKEGREEVALDFEHNTVEGTPEYARSQEPRPVAAFGKPVVVSGDGLYLENLSWTETGKANFGHYADLSAAPWLDGNRVVVGLHSGALCRAGAAYGIHKFTTAAAPGNGVRLTAFSVGSLKGACYAPAGAEAGAPQKISAPVGAGKQTKNQEIQMTELTLEAFSAKLAEALKPFEDRLAALEKQPKPDVAALSARLDAHEKGLLDEQRARIVPLFAAEGKAPVNPGTGKAYTADELAALDLPTLRVLHANTPQTVPLAARAGNPREAGHSGGRTEAISALTDTILNRDKCGRDEAFRRARKERPDLFNS